jgi:hypothetical protein
MRAGFGAHLLFFFVAVSCLPVVHRAVEETPTPTPTPIVIHQANPAPEPTPQISACEYENQSLKREIDHLRDMLAETQCYCGEYIDYE